jgi:ADP-ribosyl-[dinitrogen reductase] hydrolase
MLLKMAIADSYGAGFEYAPENMHLNNPDNGYIKHPKYNIGNGRYTDDSQMASALAEHIIEGRPIERIAFAHSFLDAFKRDPREGYSKRVYAALQTANTGQELFDILSPYESIGNGACMRAAVLGFIEDEKRVYMVAREQALATHYSRDGGNSSQCVALASWALRNGISRFDLINILTKDGI